jgi:hypothetical protein
MARASHHEVGQPRKPITVKAKVRKRCPHCSRMIEVGADAVLTDDRHIVHQRSQNHGGGCYSAVRGAYHLWHPACRAEHDAAVKTFVEAERARHDAALAALRAGAN